MSVLLYARLIQVDQPRSVIQYYTFNNLRTSGFISAIPFDHGNVNFGGFPIPQKFSDALLLSAHLQQKVEEQEAKMNELIDEFKIDHIRHSRGTELSGGERRRVEIARSLATDPAFILLDEPFAGIDPIAVADIQGMIAHLAQRGIGILITDHNVRETLSIVDKAYILASGKVLLQGSSETIANDPMAKKYYLGENFKM